MRANLKKARQKAGMTQQEVYKTFSLDERVDILEKRVDRLENAFKIYLYNEKKSLRDFRAILSRLKEHM